MKINKNVWVRGPFWVGCTKCTRYCVKTRFNDVLIDDVSETEAKEMVEVLNRLSPDVKSIPEGQ